MLTLSHLYNHKPSRSHKAIAQRHVGLLIKREVGGKVPGEVSQDCRPFLASLSALAEQEVVLELTLRRLFAVDDGGDVKDGPGFPQFSTSLPETPAIAASFGLRASQLKSSWFQSLML